MAWVPRRLGVTAAMVGFSLFGDSMMYAVLPTEAAGLGLSASAVGWILSVNRWVRLVTNPIAARVAARLGWQGPFLAALVVGGLTTIGYGVLNQVWALLLARALWGFCWSFLRHGSYEAMLESSTKANRGSHVGFLSGFFRLGSLVGMFLGGILADTIGFQATLVIFGLSTICGLGVAAWDGWFVRRSPPAGSTGTAAAPKPQRTTVLTALKNPKWLGVSLSGFLVQGLTSGLVTATLGFFLLQRFPDGVPVGTLVLGVATLTGALLSIRWVSGIAVSPVMGYLSDRLGRHTLLIAGAVVGALGLVSLAQAPGLPLVVIGVLLLWLAESGMGPALDAKAADLAEHEGAEAMGVYATGVDMGAATGPILGYTLIGQGISLPAVYQMGAGALILLAVLTWTAHRKGDSYVAAGKERRLPGG